MTKAGVERGQEIDEIGAGVQAEGRTQGSRHQKTLIDMYLVSTAGLDPGHQPDAEVQVEVDAEMQGVEMDGRAEARRKTIRGGRLSKEDQGSRLKSWTRICEFVPSIKFAQRHSLTSDTRRDDYWGSKNKTNGDVIATAASAVETAVAPQPAAATAALQDDGDIDMVE